jgi:hypothetical protein
MKTKGGNAMWKTAIIILTLTACAGSPPRPVATHQFGDDKMSCAMLASEIQRTQVQIGKKQSEHSGKLAQNTVAVGMGLFFLPALFSILHFPGVLYYAQNIVCCMYLCLLLYLTFLLVDNIISISVGWSI